MQLEIKNVGKVDPKRHLEEKVDVQMTNCIGTVDKVFFCYTRKNFPDAQKLSG